MKRLLIYIILILSLLPGIANAQLLSTETHMADSLRKEFDSGPYFTLYKDNYFLVGSELGQTPTGKNSDVKFQISISQRLTKSTLPWGTYLFVAYTQKCFWNVFEKSLPMRDLNFNPAIGISKPLFSKDRYVGKLTLLVEHESNGKDSIQSRSWNKVSLAANVVIDEWLMVHGKVWIPIIDSGNNRDILRYSGIFQGGVAITTPNKRFGWNVMLTKRQGWNLNFNTLVEFNWKLSKNQNQYLFLQYYNGYGESMLDYNRFHNRLRVGFVIKPKFFSDF
ncbi:MAG: phospholipase A [Muribaculaceae bacterium]|nr:phospholipase A [Muribaculaceae bacterium]MBO7165457.1 phospholipase A [Muribaculaceae bacterium]